jgi:four helix bundle protein
MRGRDEGAVRDFTDLRVYQAAYGGAMEIFESSRAWPKREVYGLTDQIRRSSRSVCANLAEAWFRRRYPKYFVSKVSDSSAEAAETLVWIDLAADCGYLSPEAAAPLRRRYRYLLGGLTKMMAAPEKWCVPTDDT